MKRMLALLLCACMVLGMLPNSIIFATSSEDVPAVDQNGQGFCQACNKTVTWTAVSSHSALGTSVTDGGHYYLTLDVVNTSGQNYIQVNGKKVCFHLNGHDLTYAGRIHATNKSGTTSTLNIMGNGTVKSTATTVTDNTILVNGGESVINLYGGTYQLAGTANAPIGLGAATAKLNLYQGATVVGTNTPAVLATKGLLTVYGGTVTGGISMTAGTVTLSGNANVDNIDVAAVAKLVVKADFTGTAKVNFAAGLTDDTVPAANGSAEGNFAGTLTLQDGSKLVADDNGLLLAIRVSGELVPDANSQALCPVCEKTVTWTAISHSNALGTSVTNGGHYYLTADVNNTTGTNYIQVNGKNVCLHLNGHDLTYAGRIHVTNGSGKTSLLNIMGSGTVKNNALVADQANLGILVNGGASVINLFGGRYENGGATAPIIVDQTTAAVNLYKDAAVSGADTPAVLANKGYFTVNGGTVSGDIHTTTSTVTLEGEATVESVQIATAAKLVVKADFTGSAKVDFAAGLTNNLVSEANGSAEGSFTGTLTLPDGSHLVATAEGLLLRQSMLSLDSNSQALCPVCNEIVTWVPYSGNGAVGALKDGNHYHIYLATDIDARAISGAFLTLTGGTKLCLHLNGHDLTYGGYIMSAGNSLLNVMGSGNVTFTATTTGDTGYKSAGLYANYSPINLYGGNYTVAETAQKEARPTIYQIGSQVMIRDAMVQGKTHIAKGTMTLMGGAELEEIQVDANGKLTVDSSWAGVAAAAFAAGLSDGTVPEANGVSTGDFVGGLRLMDGTLLEGENGRLVESDGVRLRLTDDEKGYCPACGEMVKWTALHNGEYIANGSSGDGNHYHYYFADDNMTTAAGHMLVNVYKTTVCLHLNGKTVGVSGCIQLRRGALNILGDGHLDFLANGGSDTANAALLLGDFWDVEKNLNIYGGTYTSSSGKPVLIAKGQQMTVNLLVQLHGNTNLDGLVTLNQCQLYLQDSVKIRRIEASNTGSIRVAENWRGTATVDYFAEYNGAYISEYNGRSGGSFIGCLMMADGRRLVGESGKLRIVEAGERLVLNQQGEGYCEACKDFVTWMPFAGNNAAGTLADGSHYHFYLATDVDARKISGAFMTLNKSTKLCLHLNDRDLTFGGYAMVTGDSVLTIMGSGNVTFTATTTGSDGYKIGGLYVAGATLNLYGGNYCVAETALAEDRPVIYQLYTSKTTVQNAVVRGRTYIGKGMLTLDGMAELEKIDVDVNGKLQVESTWEGAAEVGFAAAFIGNQIIATNGSSTGAFGGKLTLADGRAVTGEGGKLVIGGETVPGNISYKLTDTAEIVSVSGAGNFLLPTHIAGRPVTAIAADAFKNFTGTLYIGKNNSFGIAYAQAQNLTFIEATSFTLESGVVQLLADAEGMTFDQDTVLDLNGYKASGVTVTGGILSVMDSQTDDFTVADGIYGKITGISGTVQAAEGYLQITEEAGVSFHRIDLDIYAMTLRASQVGVYYKSSFAGDEVVAAHVESYGIALSITEAPNADNLETYCGYSMFSDFQAGEGANAGSSTLLKNIMKAGISDEKNAARAAMPVYGRAYIKTADGYFFGETVQRSLQEQVELADAAFGSLTDAQKEETEWMLENFRGAVEGWNLPNLTGTMDRLWYSQPAPDTGEGFEQYSMPIGNGYMGVSIFGGTETETLSLSDKTMFNPTITGQNNAPEVSDTTMQYGQGGYTNMCKVHIDFGHAFSQVSDYRRDLTLGTAEAHVSYNYDGVIYKRTYFASYPDNVTVMKLDASQSGKLSFTLCPEATYIRDYAVLLGDGAGKTGTVTASGDTATVAGTLKAYNVNYEAQMKVIPLGGTMVANADGTITVENADSAVILLTCGTNYELKPETLTASNSQKLDPNSFPHEKVTATMNAAAAKTYQQLRETHLTDYQELYGRVELDLGGQFSPDTPTDKLMQAYRAGDFDPYIEQLLFQYGRYLLIASSRSGSLPANLQGVWQYYPAAAWDGAYVYNINLQMNYWSAFATNLAELVEPNIDFFDAIWSTLESNADKYLTGVNSPNREASGTGANGIAVGAKGTPYTTPTVSTSINSHTGPGSTAYTSDLLWQYYQFTMDEETLRNRIYPYLEGAATFLSKTLEEYDGRWLVSHSASPENNMYFEEPFVTVGTMFDQMMVRESFVQVLEAARLLRFTSADSPILADAATKLPLLDPVNVGKDGHVKEYREEEYYGEYGLYEHHGMGQLVGVYPGTTITSETNAWQDAAATTAIERGINFTGHQASFKQLVWARLGNAENSYLLAQEHIVKYIRDNLWNTHTPFQIDGNFGYTAGVAEMLLQSHEGYIKVLPALPEQWNTGSYKGLTARGGFEVDVTWENCNATEITITSNAGQPCSLNHFRISTATVVDSKGNAVAFTVDSADQITFATTAGETYRISNLSVKPKMEAPADLTVSGSFNLSWKASSDAVSYRIYRAVNDQATYELVAENVTETAYSYNPTDLKVGDQLILRVTAVNADGVESDGVRAITWIED